MNNYVYTTACTTAIIASSNHKRMLMRKYMQRMKMNRNDGGISLMDNELFSNLIGKTIKVDYFDGCSETGEVIQVSDHWIKLKLKKEQEILVNTDCVKSIKVK